MRERLLSFSLCLRRRGRAMLIMVPLLAAGTAVAAGLESSVVVKGTGPGGEVEAGAGVTVPVVKAAPGLQLTIAAEPEGDAGAGETITLTYRVENSGNVTLSGVTLTASQNGQGGWQAAAPDEGANPERLAPGEAAVFRASYTVAQADIEQNGVDGLVITTAARAEARYAETPVSAEDSQPLAIEPVRATLEVVETPDRDGEVAAGDTITYAYEVTNTGNVAISAISLIINHNGSGPAPVPGNESLVADVGVEGDSRDATSDGIWDLLGPGDHIRFTGTYVVTQADIDGLQ